MSAYLVDFSRSGGDLVYGLFHGRLKSSQVYCYGGGLRNVFRELTHQTCTFLPAPGSTPKARGAPNSVRSHFRDFRILETIQISKISNSKNNVFTSYLCNFWVFLTLHSRLDLTWRFLVFQKILWYTLYNLWIFFTSAPALEPVSPLKDPLSFTCGHSSHLLSTTMGAVYPAVGTFNGSFTRRQDRTRPIADRSSNQTEPDPPAPHRFGLIGALALTRAFVNSVLVVCSNMQLWLVDRMRLLVPFATRCSWEERRWWNTWNTRTRTPTPPALPVST